MTAERWWWACSRFLCKRIAVAAVGRGGHSIFELSGCSLLRIVLGICALACTLPGRPANAAESPPAKNVLVLYGFSDRSFFDSLDNLKSAIRSRMKSPVNFYVHYMESPSFEDPRYVSGLAATLSREYDAVKLDLVIVATYPALRFAVTYRDRIFPSVPVLFSYVYAGRLGGEKLWPGVTGVTISIDIRGTLELVFRLHPDTRNLALVTGTSEFESHWQTVVRNEFRAYADKARLIELVGLPNDEVLKQIAGLPTDTIVLFQLTPRDSTQPEVGYYDAIEATSQRLPTYCLVRNFFFGHGAIGGSYSDYAEQSSKTGEMAARLLSGEKPENIPVAHGSAAQVTVDWRQLQRWKIPERALPAGAIVLYREPSIWARYHQYIPAGIAVIVLQTLLIAGLLWQRARRRSATHAVEKLGGLLIRSQEEERASIARELHDDFSQRLAVQCIELTQLGNSLPESQAGERAKAVRLLNETKEMSADMRSLSHRLHSSRLELVGLVPALSGLCEEITRTSGVAVRFEQPEFPPSLTKDEDLCLFRVAQEALANVVKHSQASSARVELSSGANGVSLRITDTGKGFDPQLKSAGAGIGLVGLRERLRLLGGTLSVRSELMRGTEVLAEIPPPKPARRFTRHRAEGAES